MDDNGEYGMINSKGKGEKRSEMGRISNGKGEMKSEKKKHSFLSREDLRARHGSSLVRVRSFHRA